MAKKKIKKVSPVCSPKDHSKCWGMSVLVLGVLVLLNAIYGWFGWGVFVGGIIILKGLVLLLHQKWCK